nr:ABC transporter ATP-binding protein [bacterium]
MNGRFSGLKRIFGLTKPYKKLFVLVLVLHVINISTRLVAPYVSQVLIDDVIGRGMMEKLYWVLGVMLGLSVLRAGLFIIRAYQGEIIGQSAIFDLKMRLYRHLQELPFKFYDEHRIGEIMSRLTGDVEGLRHMITAGWLQVIEMAVYFIGATTIMMIYNVKLTFLILLVMPFLGVLAYRYDRRIGPVYADIREQNATLNTRVQENIAGVRVVKAFAREDYEIERFDEDNNEVLRRNLAATRVWSKFNPIIDFLGGLPTPILLLFGTLFAIASPDSLTLGDLVAMNGYLWMISDPFRAISWIVNMIQNSLTSAEKVFYYIDLGATIKEKPDAVFPEEFKGHVTFDHVWFKYGDHVVLEDICFDVSPGKTLAIMGATGTGKTSIVNLLPRFYECYRGRVLIDGIDVKDYKLQQLRAQIGNVMQETFLFSETLEENIAFGRPGLDMESVEEAADIAQASEFVSQMPDGYDSLVGERGMGLSGGQKQRVAIARALAIDPKILVLDDSTSAVDMETEFEIQRKLKARRNQATTFIIAHRISSVKDADEIIVLENNKIAERGTHDSLLKQGGLYYQMFQDQYRDFDMVKSSLSAEEA